jgi:hypothetical protein
MVGDLSWSEASTRERQSVPGILPPERGQNKLRKLRHLTGGAYAPPLAYARHSPIPRFPYPNTSLTTLPATSVSHDVAAAVEIGEQCVIEPQQVQDRGVQVVNIDLVFDRREAEDDGLVVSDEA